MQVVIIVVCVNESDFLRASLPRTRRSMPDAKVILVTVDDDKEAKAIASALRVETVGVPRAELTKNGALFNFAAFARAGQLAATNAAKVPFWMIVTRPHVIIDNSIANLPFTSLERDSVYGCSTQVVKTGADLVKYIVNEPSAEEVRRLAPVESFLMTHSQGALFPAWSKNTEQALDLFLANFVSKYMIQKKLAHLGDVYRDTRVCSRWGVTEAVRIAPVHPNTQETATKNAAKELLEKKPKFGIVDDEVSIPLEKKPKFGIVDDEPVPQKSAFEKKPKFGIDDDNVKQVSDKEEGRKEMDVQQHVPIQRGESVEEVVGFKKFVKVNPWKAPVDLN